MGGPWSVNTRGGFGEGAAEQDCGVGVACVGYRCVGRCSWTLSQSQRFSYERFDRVALFTLEHRRLRDNLVEVSKTKGSIVRLYSE